MQNFDAWSEISKKPDKDRHFLSLDFPQIFL